MSIELGNNLRMVWNWGNFLSEDTQPSIINTATNTLVCSLEGHTDYIRGVIALGDGRLATWSNDCTVRVWQLDGTCDLILDGHKSYTSAVFELDGGRLLSSDGEGTLNCWDLKTGDRLWTTPLPEGVDRFMGPDLSCRSGNRVLAKCFNSWVLYNLDDGAIVRAEISFNGSAEACNINDDIAIIHNHEQADIIAWASGETLKSFPLDGRNTQVLSVGDSRVFTAHRPFLSDAPTGFKLYSVTRDGGVLVDQISMSSDEILWMKHDVETDNLTLSLADYRQIELSLSPLKIKSNTGVPGHLSEGFTAFAPEENIAQLTDRLSVSWMDKKSGLIASIDDVNSSAQIASADILNDGRFCVWAAEQWRVFDSTYKGYDTLSPELMRLEYPEHIAKVEWQTILERDNSPALASHMALRLALPVERIEAQVEALKQAQNGRRVKFAACHDGSIAAWETGSGNLWHMDEDLVFSHLAVGDKELFLQSNLILSPNGTVHRLGDKGCVPIEMVNHKPLQLHSDYRDLFESVRWCSGNRLVLKHGSGVQVMDPHSGERIDFLDGGHGMGNWGFVELDDGKLVTWTRLSLRSWSAKDYSPLVELQDPEDWGPGYEQVMSFGNRVGFFVGDYSGDNRIMIWDGENSLGVYGGHIDEVLSLKRLSPDTFLSLAGRHGADNYQTHLWKIP